MDAIKQLLVFLKHVSYGRRLKIYFFLLLLILSAFAEVISIGSVIPFLGAITSPDYIFSQQYLKPFINFFEIHSESELLFPLTVIFCTSVIVAGLLRLMLLRYSTKLVQVMGTDVSLEIYKNTIFRPYSVHVSTNSSKVINGITTKVNASISNIKDLFSFISSFVIFISIIFSLFYVDFYTSIIVFMSIGVFYFVVLKLSGNILLSVGKTISIESTKALKSIQEGLGGIRDIILDGSQEVFCNSYYKSEHLLRRARAVFEVVSQSPRYIIETLGILVIAFIAYDMAQNPDKSANVIPILGAIALGAQKLLPLSQQMYSSWSAISSGRYQLKDVIDFIEYKKPNYLDSTPIEFNKNLSLVDVCYNYDSNSKNVLKNINLSINKGEVVGFVGVTGSGKSTLLDILMGLLHPVSGYVKVDKNKIDFTNINKWRKNIAHVPQFIYLSDTSVMENIAFGVPLDKIDKSRVYSAAEGAQIASVINSWKYGYDTKVGENGVKMSGGQRQRLGIARALYKGASVIILDEATSALDSLTEKSVMDSIHNTPNNTTILIVTHRVSTLKNCKKIYEIDDGRIVKVHDSSYDISEHTNN